MALSAEKGAKGIALVLVRGAAEVILVGFRGLVVTVLWFFATVLLGAVTTFSVAEATTAGIVSDDAVSLNFLLSVLCTTFSVSDVGAVLVALVFSVEENSWCGDDFTTAVSTCDGAAPGGSRLE